MIKEFIRFIASRFNVEIVSCQKFDQLSKLDVDAGELIQLMSGIGEFEGESKAQLYQDVFVLLLTKFKKNGYFVEFGATNGVNLSNTHLLEKSYGWRGILAEPAKIWHADLVKNRSADIELSCVWKKTGELLKFNMVDDAELSTISKFNDSDQHANERKNGVSYEVRTISLNDLLEKYGAPRNIDYLSIDTEGSEYDILRSFAFDKYDISIISCEHNYTDNREKVYDLLTSYGYERRFQGFSKWDDWYFKI